MVDIRNIESAVLSIYDATLEPSRWPGVLDIVSDIVDARGAFLFDIDQCQGVSKVKATFHTTNYDPNLVKGYLDTHNEQELEDQAIFAACSCSLDRTELIHDTVLAPSRDGLMARANARAMAGYGIQYRAGALLNKDQYYSDRFAMQFSERAGLPSGERMEAIATLMPHMAKALNIGRQTSRAHNAKDLALNIFNQLRIGICILTKAGCIVFANKEFDRQLDKHGAFGVTSDKRLFAKNERVRSQLAELFDTPRHHGKFGARPRKEAILHPLSDDGMALCIEVTPLSSQDYLGDRSFSGFAVFSLDATQPIDLDTRFIADAFSLTESEEAVLKLLGEGLTNAQISERRSRSLETVSSQVKALLSKTMSQNRTQLIRLATEYSPRLFVDSIPLMGDETTLSAG
jgi:DNA-binding CsgD family transcriptional regulator